MDADFLLETDTAKELYHAHAKQLPIIDYHCHLDPAQVAADYRFADLTEIWLGGDHYKWRAMRANGVDESYITGNRAPYEKFLKWAETVPYTMRNPLYHWTHLELSRIFGIDEVLNPTSARSIYETCTALLQTDEYRAQGLMKKMRVETVCTTDDPVDSLEYHRAVAERPFGVRMLPTWRPDKALAADDPGVYAAYLQRLEAASDRSIVTFDDLLGALRARHDYFAAAGCRLSDHGIGGFYSVPYTGEEVRAAFAKVRAGRTLTGDELAKLRSALLYELAAMNSEKGWVQQFHFGAIRNNNERMWRSLGPDTGFDSIGDGDVAASFNRFFSRLDADGCLAKTIVYNLNPRDNELMVTNAYNFNDGSVPGKMQYGAAWWFLDQKTGIENQLNALSALGLLSRFVGMLTDSRSFLSYPRHEYFRRILCNLLGRDVENGELPASELPFIGQMVENICYYNAKDYFKF